MVLSLMVESSIVMALLRVPSPKISMPAPSPALVLPVTVVPESVRSWALVDSESSPIPPPPWSPVVVCELSLMVSFVSVAVPPSDSSMPPPEMVAVLSVTVEVVRVMSPQSRMPPPLPPEGSPSSTVTPEMSAVVPDSTLSTREVTPSQAVTHCAWITATPSPAPSMVTVLPLSFTSSCPSPLSTSYCAAALLATVFGSGRVIVVLAARFSEASMAARSVQVFVSSTTLVDVHVVSVPGAARPASDASLTTKVVTAPALPASTNPTLIAVALPSPNAITDSTATKRATIFMSAPFSSNSSHCVRPCSAAPSGAPRDCYPGARPWTTYPAPPPFCRDAAGPYSLRGNPHRTAAPNGRTERPHRVHPHTRRPGSTRPGGRERAGGGPGQASWKSGEGRVEAR